MSVEEAITFLHMQGFDVGDLRVQQAYRDQKAWEPLVLPDSFLVADQEETADLYFSSFDDGGLKAPPFAFRNLAVGRCFTLTRGQLQVIRDRYSVKTSNQATVVDMETQQSKVASITFYFASQGKTARLRIAEKDLISWHSASKLLDEQYQKEAEEREAAKPKVKRGKSLDALADEWLSSEFGLGI